MTDGQIQNQLAAGRWAMVQPLLEGVYVTHAGPLEYLTRCWAFLLYAGPGAVLAWRRRNGHGDCATSRPRRCT